MPDTGLVPVAAADTRRARLEHEGAVLSRTLDIFEQARHRVLASAPPGSEYAPVVADKVAKQHAELLSKWTEVWTVRDRALLAAFAAATPATDAEDMDEGTDAPARFVPAVDLGGWLARMEAIRDANRATVTIIRVPDARCEGWCGQACPPSVLTEVEAEGHTVQLCPACTVRLAGTRAKQLGARPKRRRTRKPTPRPAPRNTNGADA